MVLNVFVVFQGECFVSIGREMTLLGELMSWEGLREKGFVCFWEAHPAGLVLIESGRDGVPA